MEAADEGYFREKHTAEGQINSPIHSGWPVRRVRVWWLQIVLVTERKDGKDGCCCPNQARRADPVIGAGSCEEVGLSL